MEKDSTSQQPPDEGRSLGKSIIVGVVGALSAVYLLNPGWGAIELIPDNIPGIGNLDEVGAAALLISCLAYFGLDVRAFVKRADKAEKKKKDDVIDVEVTRE